MANDVLKTITQVPFLDLPAEYLEHKDEFDAAALRVMASGAFIQGPDVAALEKELAAYVGVKHCVTCSSGTDGLLLALHAAGVEPGDEVVTTPFTFFATAGQIALLGAVPVFVDIDPVTFLMDVKAVRNVLTKKTKAIMPVSLYGQPADLKELRALATERGLAIIEDAAQSFGAVSREEGAEKRSCGLTDIGVTSFFPTKPLGGFGDGGAVFTDRDDLALDLRQRMNQGQSKRYEHARLGWNGRYDTLQAAILRIRLAHFPETLARRQAAAARYQSLLASLPIVLPTVKADRTSAWAQYAVRVKNRDKVAEILGKNKVAWAVHYPSPVYRQEALASMRIDPARFPETEKACGEILCLPMSPRLSEPEQKRVAEALGEALAGA